MKPTIGRIVHFVKNGEHLAAIVVHVWSDTCVNLYVFASGMAHGSSDFINNGMLFTSVVLDESVSPQHYSWHWPERD